MPDGYVSLFLGQTRAIAQSVPLRSSKRRISHAGWERGRPRHRRVMMSFVAPEDTSKERIPSSCGKAESRGKDEDVLAPSSKAGAPPQW